MEPKGQVCARCVMDQSDPAVTFDEKGVCSSCLRYDEVRAQRGYRQGVSEKELEHTLSVIRKESQNLPYDCIVGLSGGVDSAYMLYSAIKLGLRPLVIHVDSGWNTPLAEENIRRVCDRLQVKLHIYKVDWEAMKELQRAYMLSGVANIDVPQDHLFCAALYQMAREYKVKFILNGSNIATEGAAEPFSLQHTYRDAWHMKSIYKKHGRGKSIAAYPFLPIREAWLGLKGVTKINLLDSLPYSKAEAIRVLEEEFGWQYYGAKHYESVFTRYEQGVYLPTKFQFDKRRYHLSCLILNGEMTREEALTELENPPYPEDQQKADEQYILEKLDIDPTEWHQILHSPPTPDDAYFSQQKLFNLAKSILGKKGLDGMKKKIYSVK